MCYLSHDNLSSLFTFESTNKISTCVPRMLQTSAVAAYYVYALSSLYIQCEN